MVGRLFDQYQKVFFYALTMSQVSSLFDHMENIATIE